jgi:hypothetical protein
MSEIPRVTTDPIEVSTNDDNNQDLRTMIKQFITYSTAAREADRQDIAELRLSVQSILQGSPSKQDDDSVQTPPPDRRKQTRRTSMFFGSPGFDKQDASQRSQIQVLQADIIYDKNNELKVSSLEGLQYLAKQIALISSIYPNREIKIAHMVSYNLRPHVVAAWNSHCYKESLITGIPAKEIMVEDWLSLSNEEVHSILIESARPRTRELYSRELVMFLGKGIPQTPDINTENFNKIFYVPLMKSLNNLLNLHDLLSEDTSQHSNNISKMPSVTYGTKDSPGHIALWIISLGNQKDAILQWLGKDELVKHKSVESAVKYIRSKLMEGRSQSEARQDLDAKLTPIRYEDIRHTQAESYQRYQVPQIKQRFRMPDHKYQQSKSKLAFSALDATTDPDDPPMIYDDNMNDCVEESNDYNDDTNIVNSEDYVVSQPEDVPFHHNDSLTAVAEVNSFRSAIAITFRGYCCELFVFGQCSKRDSGCPYDHSTASQERCIQSFSLLAKRELRAHSQLPPYVSPMKPPTHSQSRIPKPATSTNNQPRTYTGFSSQHSNHNAYQHGSPSLQRNYNK